MSARSKYTFDSFSKRDDTRRKQIKYTQDLSADQQDLYNSLINLVVNHKMELQKIPAASHPETAAIWAEKKGLRAGQQDFNNDGHPETVIYNKAGNPFIINGYKLKPSDYAIRNKYWGAHKTRADRIEAGPMREWIIDQAYKVDIPDPDRFWNRNVSTTDFGHQLKKWGYRMPTKPKKQLSVFQDFCKRIAPYVKDYFEGWEDERGEKQLPLITLLGEDCGDNCSKFIKKIISPITIYRMLYIKIVERYYYLELKNLQAINGYDNFKKYCKQHPDDLWDFYTTKLLTRTENGKIEFKESKVNIDVICRLFANDGLDWTMKDFDDVICFLISKKNYDDQTFNDILLVDENAKAFFDEYENGTKAEKKHLRKLLEKWKENARESTKVFFEKHLKQMFDHKGVQEKFELAKEEGINPIDPNPEVANEVSREDVETQDNITKEEVAADNSQQNTTQVELSGDEEDAVL